MTQRKTWIKSATLTVGGAKKGGRLLIEYGCEYGDNNEIGPDFAVRRERLSRFAIDVLLAEVEVETVSIEGAKDNEVVFHLTERSAFGIVKTEGEEIKSNYLLYCAREHVEPTIEFGEYVLCKNVGGVIADLK